ncbi:MAG TPA: histidine kinase [Solirubrobacteraceae bacterium]|nr:histidine kinase [Solirubrobacteraceae bacterium]
MPDAADLGWIALVAAAFVVARHARTPHAVAGGVAVAIATVALAVAGSALVPLAITVSAAFAVGRALRERRVMADRLTERARELEDEREAYAQLSVRYERARIAAELHDIVAHAISVMVVQAAAGQRLAAGDPDLTAEAFGAIREAARQAEEDLERLVALLAEGEPSAGAPDLALVEELVARAAGSGLDVRLELRGDRELLPARSVQVAYRVVQEGLTNALRYAAGAAVHVLIDGRADALAVEVVNGPGRRGDVSGTGTGLRGLRERLAEVGGALDAAPTADGGWALRARLPRRIPAAA